MTMVKFCGIRRAEDVEYINALKPQYAGFVFWKESSRYVTPDEAVALADSVSEDIQLVGVFLDEPIENILSIAQTGCIDIIQLHGSESERYIRMVKTFTGLPVIKAFSVKTEEDVSRAENTEADYIMLDSGAGTGKAFDWSLIEKVGRPYFLAGGLAPENVGEAISRLHPFAVDTSSGIETDGRKDREKMEAFMRSVREADQSFNITEVEQ